MISRGAASASSRCVRNRCRGEKELPQKEKTDAAGTSCRQRGKKTTLVALRESLAGVTLRPSSLGGMYLVEKIIP